MSTICKKRRRKKLKINTQLEEVTSNLPCGIIENILSRLPVKSLLRFKSVSKPWYSLISDSKFARVHLQQSINSDYKTILMRSPKIQHTFLRLTNQNFQIESSEFPIKKYREAKVLCSCDGLVLLTSRRLDNIFILWNPATRAYTKFSSPYKASSESGTFGLFYDASNDDYKVVCINRQQLSVNKHIGYAVFSLKNNYWIEEKYFCLVRWLGWNPGLSVNGALHWVMSEERKELDSKAKEGRRLQQIHYRGDNYNNYDYSHNVNDLAYSCNYDYTFEICCFDPRDNKFKKLSKPACFDISCAFQLSALRSELSICRYTYDFSMVEIWTMKEYGDCNSWTKLLTIENVLANRNVRVLDSICYVKPLCLTKEGNYVLEIFQSGIVIYSPKDNKFDEIHVPDEDNPNCPRNMTLFPFLCWNDSLLLPTRINKIKRKQVDYNS